MFEFDPDPRMAQDEVEERGECARGGICTGGYGGVDEVGEGGRRDGVRVGEGGGEVFLEEILSPFLIVAVGVDIGSLHVDVWSGGRGGGGQPGLDGLRRIGCPGRCWAGWEQWCP